MQRGRSVTGPLRRAHPASGATWNVQVVRGKMSSQCLWHACRALSAGLLLMLIGGAMAVIGYYAETLSVAQELRGNATVAVKDEARTFHLNNLSYAGPIVMGFGAAPRAMAATRRPVCAGPARWDQLGVYRLPTLPPLPLSLPHPLALPHQHLHSHRRSHTRHRGAVGGDGGAAESECGSQSSLALDLHYGCGGSGVGMRGAAVTLRVTDNTRRRTLARQPRLRDEPPSPTYSPAAITGGAHEKTFTPSLCSKRETTGPAARNEGAATEEAPPRACSVLSRAPSEYSESSEITSIQASHSQACLFTKHISTETHINIDENISPGIEEEPEFMNSNNFAQTADVYINDIACNEHSLQNSNCYTSNNLEIKDQHRVLEASNVDHDILQTSSSNPILESSANNAVEKNSLLTLRTDDTTQEVENVRLHFECEKSTQNDKSKDTSEEKNKEKTDKSINTE